MGRVNKDVGGYRGRRTVTDVLKLIAIILGVLVVLAVAGMLYLQKYMVYTDEGVKLELPPFLQMLLDALQQGHFLRNPFVHPGAL